MRWVVEYYVKKNGKIPVVEHLISLNPKLRAKAQLEIELLEEHGLDLKEPYVKAIRGKRYRGLMELRIKFGSDTSRIFYFMVSGNKFILLHGFLKKTNKTPVRELDKALGYKDDFERRVNHE